MITKGQWQAIASELSSQFASVTFQLDDDEVTVNRVRLTENKTALAVYINGSIKWGEGWPESNHFNPRIQLLWRQRSKAMYGPKKKQQLEKRFGKRRARQIFDNLDVKIQWYDPCFTTAASLIRQYKKIDGLTLIKCGFKAAEEVAA